MQWCVLSALLASTSGFQPGHVRHASTRMQASTLPKDETGVSQLRDTNPDADGRGVLVAVLDTGCDLAAAGLQITSTGQPKYVDFLDCTGGGDVDMSVSRKKSDDGTLEGASGATLTLGAWADSVDEFRVGAAP